MLLPELDYDPFAGEALNIAPSGHKENMLDIGFDDQAKSKWCWAAVSLELCRSSPGQVFLSLVDPSQEDLAQEVRGDTANEAMQVSAVVQELKDRGWLGRSYYRNYLLGADLAKEFRDSVDAGFPVSVVIDWAIGPTHNVCVYGYLQSTSTSYLYWVYDPSATDKKATNTHLLADDEFDEYPGWLTTKEDKEGRRIFGSIIDSYSAER